MRVETVADLFLDVLGEGLGNTDVEGCFGVVVVVADKVGVQHVQFVALVERVEQS